MKTLIDIYNTRHSVRQPGHPIFCRVFERFDMVGEVASVFIVFFRKGCQRPYYRTGFGHRKAGGQRTIRLSDPLVVDDMDATIEERKRWGYIEKRLMLDRETLVEVTH